MRLHVVYRSHGGENAKGRPGWYSKQVGLQSFCRAVEAAAHAAPTDDVEVTFLNDGPIPGDRLQLMRRWGDPVTIKGGSNRRSYLQGVALARRRDWPAADAVLLAEDDYLWRPQALTELLAAQAAPGADYLAPYGSDAPEGSEASDSGEPTRWVRIDSTTSTFAARVAALREDERLLQLCAYSGGDFDYTSCLTLQGRPRFGLAEIFRHHAPAETTSGTRTAARWLYLSAMRLAVDARALRRGSRRRVLLGAQPALATHMETGWISPGRWQELAEAATAWAEG